MTSTASTHHVGAGLAVRSPAAAPVLLWLFMISLLIPASYEILGLRLSAERMIVLLCIIPLGIQWISQKAGSIVLTDILILLHGIWLILALFVNHGAERVAFAGMLFAELFGGYLVGRMLIQDAVAYKRLFQTMLWVILLLLPVALLEMSTGKAYMQEFFRSALGSAHNDVDHPPRLGLYRVQSVMQHPILWGVFCSIAVANSYYIWSYHFVTALSRMGLAFFASFLSLSAGAFLATLFQVMLMVWGWMTKGAWKPLIIGFLSIYAFLSLASNRGPVVLLVQLVTFDANTGWTRIYIWQHGIDDVLANPIFGIGLHPHTRPFWLAPSVDNFWLVIMMRTGFTGFFLLAGGILWHIYKVTTAKGLSDYERQLRMGYMIGLVSLIFSLATVHFWGPPYILFFAYLGAGVWFYHPSIRRTAAGSAHDHAPDSRVASERPAQDNQSLRPSRLPDSEAPRANLPFARADLAQQHRIPRDRQ